MQSKRSLSKEFYTNLNREYQLNLRYTMQRRENTRQEYQQGIEKFKRIVERYKTLPNRRLNEQKYSRERQVGPVELNDEMERESLNEY